MQAARISGVDIPNQKYIEFSLQYVYGIGHTTSKAILAASVRQEQSRCIRLDLLEHLAGHHGGCWQAVV